VKRTRIPPGELAVHQGARVEVANGRVGRVDEFLVDPGSGHITHLVLRKGHPRDPKHVILVVSDIDRIEEDTVRLKIDKHTVESLPANPVRRRHN